MSEPIYNSAGEVLYPGLAGDGAGYRGSRLVTLTPEGWEEAEGTWPLMQDAPVPEAKTGYVALGSYPDSYGAAAQEAGCPAYCEAQDGFVRFYARAKPSGDIRVQVTLLGEAGSAAGRSGQRCSGRAGGGERREGGSYPHHLWRGGRCLRHRCAPADAGDDPWHAGRGQRLYDGL